MKLAMAGLSYRSASLNTLERASYRREELAPASSRVRALEGVAEAVVLSTCHRTEAYAIGVDALKGE